MSPSDPAPPSPRSAWALLLFVVILWGANWPIMKYGLQYIPPIAFAAARMVLGTAVLAAVAAWRGQLQWPHRDDWPVVLGVGLLQMAAFSALVNLGLQYVSAGRSAILAYTTPLWVLPLAVWRLREPLTRLRLLGVTLGLAGVVILFNPLAFDWRDPQVLFGNGALLLAALLWAVLIVQVRGHRWRGTPLSLAPWQTGIAALVLLPLSLALEDVAHIRWEAPLWIILLYNGPITTAFCFWAMITVTRALPAITTSLATLSVPLVGYLASMAMLGEALPWNDLAGFVFILTGLVAATLDDALRHRRSRANRI